MDISILHDKTALIVGLGLEGQQLARYLVRNRVSVIATDVQPAKKFGDTLDHLRELGVEFVLGEHPDSLLDRVHILFVSPGVPLNTPFLALAKSRQLPLCTETKLFCLLCPAPIIGITGSSGKSTTTTLVAQVLQASGRKTWLGGNIGQPLINRLDEISPDDIVVLELSSFQLEYFRAKLNKNVVANDLKPLLKGWSPDIAAILNITPNHLDRHVSMRSYVQAKRAIIDSQGPQGQIIMSLDNDVTRTIGNQFRHKVRWFSVKAERPNGASLHQENLTMVSPTVERTAIMPIAETKLLGQHNLANMLSACLITDTVGASVETMREVLSNFTGIEHRLEPVRELDGVHYYNDSIATSPDRMVAALRSFQQPIVLLAGGRDKQLSWEEAARVIGHKVRHLITFGEASSLISETVARVDDSIPHSACDTLEQAVQLARQAAQQGDVVLLAPGCTSYDQFPNFAVRGQRFKEIVLSL